MPKDAQGNAASVRNRDQLGAQGIGELRLKALQIAEAGLAACDGGAATRKRVRLTPDGVMIDGVLHRLDADQRLLVLGGGKATLPVAQALEEVLGDRIDGGAIVLKRGQEAELEGLEVMTSDHPFPSPDSLAAAGKIAGLAAEACEGDLVITCFTGGRSALLTLPPETVTFDEKRRLHELLIASGMPITAINTVRKHVSGIKGGRLAELIAPARIVNLTISDVAGDPQDVLADLTTQDTSTPEQALSILRRFDLIDEVPGSIISHLGSPAAVSPELGGIEISTVMLVNGESACRAMADAAGAIGLRPLLVGTAVEGEAVETGKTIASLARAEPAGTALIGCGGESTVSLGRSEPGLGGPNQEAAIAASAELEGRQAAAVFLDTDGSDGSTRFAGAICDGRTAERARELGLDLESALASHAASEPLRALEDLIDTGPTGTNVNDLFVAVTGPA